jgi:hypothetical protein
VVTYPALGGNPEITIRHKGFVNGSAVMSWIGANFNGPEFTFMTGCSAGAYGVGMFSLYLRQIQPHTPGAMLADAGAGVITRQWLLESFPTWKAYENRPMWIPGLADTPLEEFSLAKAYIAGANYYPDNIVAQYNTVHDSSQRFYYAAMGGVEEEWDIGLEASIQEISENAPNFRHFTGWGSGHCILNKERFYTNQVNGVRFRDWVADMAEGKEVPSVHCTDCESEEYYSP